MRPEFEPIDPALEQAIEELHGQTVDDAAVEAAATRVWARLKEELQPSLIIHGCADFQALMPDYRAGRLDEARALLLKDHTHECVACRKALAALAGNVVEFPQPGRKAATGWMARPAFKWAVAAAVVIGVGVTAWNVVLNMPNASRGEATVQTVNGVLYRVSNDAAMPLRPGETLPAGAEIRTAKDSDAIVRLADGSQVEMRERSGIFVSATWRDTTIHLGRGAVIVEAAKQRTGHLYVATRDVKVSVTGTVFGVASGVKGSRVSVVEGEVRVAHQQQEAILHPGDQYTSSPAITPTSVAEDIAWSRKVDQHIALLKEFTALRKQLEQVHMPDLRYASRLLDVAPANTAFFASIPNIGKTLADAHQIFRSRVQDSPVLREWWDQKMEGAQGGQRFDQMIQEVRAASDFLGDEIALAASMDENGHMTAPVLMAEVKRPGLREFMQSELTRLGVDQSQLKLDFAGSAAEIDQPGKSERLILLTADFVAVSQDKAALKQVAEALEGGSGFSGTPYYGRIRQAYRDGAGILVSADLEHILTRDPKAKAPGAAYSLGGVNQMLLEQKEVQGQTNTRATFSFAGERKGIASWLARPASINALDFISPEASALGAFALKSPGTIVDDFIVIASRNDPNFLAKLAESESKVGISLRDDLAATLGAEIAFALDGPAFPIPSWKLIVEVYDAARLQSSLQRLVDAAGAQEAAQGQAPLKLTQEAVNGRIYYRISSPLLAKIGDINYTFTDGYMVAGPSRALVDQSLSYRANHTGISYSSRFASLIPSDRYANFSGVLYHDLGATLGVLVDSISASANLTPEQRKAIQGITGDMKPMLVGVYAEDDRVVVATTSNAISLSAANLLALQGPAGVAEMLSSSVAGRAPRTRR